MQRISTILLAPCFIFFLLFSYSEATEKKNIKRKALLTPKSVTPSTSSQHKEAKNQIKTMDMWKIHVRPKEQSVMTTMSGQVLLNIQAPSMNVLFLSMDYPPASSQIVLKRLKEWGGDRKSLRVKKFKNESVFSFRVQNHIHWLSSEGGYLLATVDKKFNKKQYLSLLKRVVK